MRPALYNKAILDFMLDIETEHKKFSMCFLNVPCKGYGNPYALKKSKPWEGNSQANLYKDIWWRNCKFQTSGVITIACDTLMTSILQVPYSAALQLHGCTV